MFIVKIPFGVSGCEKSPNEILKSLKEISVNEQEGIVDFKNLDLEEIHLDNKNIGLSNELIYKNSFECFETKPKTIFLGGEHVVSYSLTRAFLDYCQSKKNQGSSYDISFKNGSGLIGIEPCLVIFDAHADCVVEKGDFPTSRDWLRRLIGRGFPTRNILLVGTRSYKKEELEFLREKKIQRISINSIEEDIDNIADTIMEFAHGKEVYVSIDFDVIEPVFIPAVENAEPGGLTTRQLIYLVQRINKMKNLRAIDLVGVNSEKDENGLSVKLVAKVLAELL